MPPIAPAAERLTNQQANAAAQTDGAFRQLDAIEDKLDENKSPSKELKDLARDVKSDLDRAAEGPMKQASKDLANASQPNAPKEERDESLASAQDQQAKAADQLQRGDGSDGQYRYAGADDRAHRADAERAEGSVSKQTGEAGKGQLGKKPEEMKPEDRKKLDDAADAQAKLAERTGKAMEDMEKRPSR